MGRQRLLVYLHAEAPLGQTNELINSAAVESRRLCPLALAVDGAQLSARVTRLGLPGFDRANVHQDALVAGRRLGLHAGRRIHDVALDRHEGGHALAWMAGEEDDLPYSTC